MIVDRGYAGDIGVAEAWAMLAEDRDATLIDVRTVAEWVFVGLPDLAGLNKSVVCVQWQVWPQMAVNGEFVPHIEAEGVARERPLLMLCRSGQRSRDAAIALTGAGFGPCYNVAGGFEGPMDDARHRGKTDGWKAAGLPWRQQ